jgi:hypothetical protein
MDVQRNVETPMEAPGIPTTICLPPSTRRAVEEMAAAQHRSVSNFLSMMIQAGMAGRADHVGGTTVLDLRSEPSRGSP